MRLDEAKVAQWERDWKTEAERFEMVGGAGTGLDERREGCGRRRTRVLDQDDPRRRPSIASPPNPAAL